IHAEQVTGKDCRLVTTGAGADFQKHVALVIGVAWQQQQVQLGFQLGQRGAAALRVVLGHGADIRIAVLEQAAGLLEISADLEPLAIALHRGFQLRIFSGIGAEPGLVTDDLGVAEQCREFLEPLAQGVQTLQQWCFHCLPCALVSLSSPNSSIASDRDSVRPSALLRLSCTLGSCSSLLVRARAISAITCAGSPPRSRRASALPSSWSRCSSACCR